MAKLTFDEALEKINDQRTVKCDDVLAEALDRKVWLASNGMPGCLNDHASVCLTKTEAIESCLFVANNGDSGPPRGMKTAMEKHEIFDHDGYLYRVERLKLRDLF